MRCHESIQATGFNTKPLSGCVEFAKPPMRTRGFEPRTSSLSATRSNQLSYVREAHSLLPILLSKWTGKCIASFPPVNGKNRRHTKHRSQPARHRPMTHGNFSKSIPIRPFLPPTKTPIHHSNRRSQANCLPYRDLETLLRYAETAGITPANVPTKINPGIIQPSQYEFQLNHSIRTPVAGIVHGLLIGPNACPTYLPTYPPTWAINRDSSKRMAVM